LTAGLAGRKRKLTQSPPSWEQTTSRWRTIAPQSSKRLELAFIALPEDCRFR